jgi:ribosome-associated protein
MTDENANELPETTEPVAKPRPVMPDDSAAFLLAERAAYHLLGRKGDDIVILDLRTLSDVCDFFVIGSGQADVQVKAMARAVRDGLADQGQKPVGYEGESDGRWILIDYVDVVVHALKPAAREYYQLERLWGDASVLVIDERHVSGEDFASRHPDLASIGGAATTDED